MRRLILFLILSAFLGLPALAVATASGKSALTGPEYQQLIFLRDKLKTSDGLTSSIYNCNTMPTLPTIHSQLLDLERTDCAAGFLLIRFNGEMKGAVKQCDRRSVVTQRLNCLMTPYEQLETLYSVYSIAESQVRQLAASRGLPPECVDTLSDPPAVIAEEHTAAIVLNNVVTDAESGDISSFETDSKKLVTTTTEISRGQQANSEPLSVCPHPRKKYYP